MSRPSIVEWIGIVITGGPADAGGGGDTDLRKAITHDTCHVK